MPIYTYICKNCGEKFDLLIGMNSEKPALICKKCNSQNIERTFGTFSVGGSTNKTSAPVSAPACPTQSCPSCSYK